MVELDQNEKSSRQVLQSGLIACLKFLGRAIFFPVSGMQLAWRVGKARDNTGLAVLLAAISMALTLMFYLVVLPIVGSAVLGVFPSVAQAVLDFAVHFTSSSIVSMPSVLLALGALRIAFSFVSSLVMSMVEWAKAKPALVPDIEAAQGVNSSTVRILSESVSGLSLEKNLSLVSEPDGLSCGGDYEVRASLQADTIKVKEQVERDAALGQYQVAYEAWSEKEKELKHLQEEMNVFSRAFEQKLQLAECAEVQWRHEQLKQQKDPRLRAVEMLKVDKLKNPLVQKGVTKFLNFGKPEQVDYKKIYDEKSRQVMVLTPERDQRAAALAAAKQALALEKEKLDQAMKRVRELGGEIPVEYSNDSQLSSQPFKALR